MIDSRLDRSSHRNKEETCWPASFRVSNSTVSAKLTNLPGLVKAPQCVLLSKTELRTESMARSIAMSMVPTEQLMGPNVGLRAAVAECFANQMSQHTLATPLYPPRKTLISQAGIHISLLEIS